jgi:hypothetical protein
MIGAFGRAALLDQVGGAMAPDGTGNKVFR